MANFDAIPSRKGSGSMKWKAMARNDPLLGPEITPFSAADMEFKNAPEIIQCLKDFLDSGNGVLAYYSGHDSYYEAVLDWVNRRHGWEIQKDWLVEMGGISPALYGCVAAFTEPGDQVLILSPVYDPFYRIVGKNGRVVVTSELLFNGTRYEMNYEEIEALARQPRTKMLLLCSPHNPIGRVWSREELTRLGQICIDNDVLVVSDEAHCDLVYPGVKHTCFASISDTFAQHCVTHMAPSKGFNLAGLQHSFTIIKNEKLREHYKRDIVSPQMLDTCNPLGYLACETAYRRCGYWLEELMEVIAANRAYVADFLEKYIPEIKVMPTEGTYLLWLDCRDLGMNGKELEQFMTQKAQLYLDEGYCFGKGGEGFERWNLACHVDVLKAALERLRAAADEWRAAK